MDMAVAAVFLSLAVMASVEELLVTAQTPTSAPSPPITCTLPNSSMVSSNYCNSYDEQSMETQTAGCNAFLTNQESAPSAACCQGLNEVAYNRTACICSYTFYPPSTVNASRQLDLPRLCGVLTNLCGTCPTFIVSRSNGTTAAPYAPITRDTCSIANLTSCSIGNLTSANVSAGYILHEIIHGRFPIQHPSLSATFSANAPTYSDGKSMASTLGAISLAVVFGLLVVGAIIGVAVKIIKKRRAKLNPPGPFEAAPPGGAY